MNLNFSNAFNFTKKDFSQYKFDDDDDEGDAYIVAYEKWEKETRPIHATIKSITDIPIGETRIFRCLDRNAIDCAVEELRIWENKDTEILPSELFKTHCCIKLTKTGDGLCCNYIIADTLEDIDHPDYEQCSDLDIEYIPDNWLPLEECYVKKWKLFEPNTRLGWRGPMIPIEKIDDTLFKL